MQEIPRRHVGRGERSNKRRRSPGFPVYLNKKAFTKPGGTDTIVASPLGVSPRFMLKKNAKTTKKPLRFLRSFAVNNR